ncbi:MAG TPA: CbiX/SirB N-terminal domain-containing protein [Myxococcota bacterium]|nr:CbiX/SirB N-terminal domain-containing protein [Myxococcota bacterium]
MRAVVLVDHGSRREEANAQLEALAERVREREPGTLVVTAHLELAAPDIGEALAACASAGAREVVLLPWFLSPGRHTAEDIPRAVAAARERHPELRVQIGEPLGLDARLVDVALSRIQDARSSR